MKQNLEVSIVIESYTHSEGTDFERLKNGLRAATEMISNHGRGEVLLTDTGGSERVSEIVAREFPHVIRVEALGMGYDEAKALAANQASGEYILYLDGDCIPSPGWMDQHLNRLRSGDALATGGFTRYESGFWASTQTVMDFGFLLPRRDKVLQCYAFNNTGFQRQLLLDAPLLVGPMRCHCYAHAQLLLRRGTPVRMVPGAMVDHQLPHFFSERFRQGYDAIAACWVTPDLPERRLLRMGMLAAFPIYARNAWFDCKRVLQGRRDLSLKFWQAWLSLPLFPLLRLVDLAGMLKALAEGEPQRPECAVPAKIA